MGRARLPEHLQFLKSSGHSLAPLTGTDSKALQAIAACWTLYAYTHSSDVLYAVRLLLREMQPKTRPLARELIAWAMDWNDRDRLWPLVAEPIPAVAPDDDQNGDATCGECGDAAGGGTCEHCGGAVCSAHVGLCCAQALIEAEGA